MPATWRKASPQATQGSHLSLRCRGRDPCLDHPKGGRHPGRQQQCLSVISPDGLYIAFHSYAQNLLADNTNISYANILLYHRTEKTFQAVNVTTSGFKPDSGVYLYCAIADEGKAVAFQSAAKNLVADKTHSYDDVFLAVKTTDAWTIEPKGIIGGWRNDLAVAGNIAYVTEAPMWSSTTSAATRP
jgi:hypothetical protein